MDHIERNFLSKWTPHIADGESIATALEKAVQEWPAHEMVEEKTPILFPFFPNNGGIFLSFRNFCELIDCCYEANRKRTSVTFVVMDKDCDQKQLRALSATIAQHIPFAPQSYYSMMDVPNVKDYIIEAMLSVKRRMSKHDQSGFLVAAICESLNIKTIYCSEGIRLPAALKQLKPLMPLGTKYAKNAFESPPFSAKSMPAGFDPVWFLGFTSELTGLAYPSKELSNAVKAKFAHMWRSLMAGGFARNGEFKPAFLDNNIHIQWRSSGAAQTTKVIVPVFAASTINFATMLMAKSYSAFFGQAAKEVTLVADDTLACHMYDEYNLSNIRQLYEQAGKDLGFEVKFTSDEGQDFIDRRRKWGQMLTGEDAWHVIPQGIRNRSRGRATTYDLAHLASMAAATTSEQDRIVAIKSTDLRGMQVIGKHNLLPGLLICNGLDSIRGRGIAVGEVSKLLAPSRISTRSSAWEKTWDSPQSFLKEHGLYV
jgi:hypothetical protein